MSGPSLPDREVQTPALILRRVAYGEQAWILTLLTRQHGMVSAMARAARTSRHRFGSGLDLFVVFEARLVSRHPSALPELATTETIQSYPGILDGLDRLEMGQAALALTHDLLKDAPVTAVTFDQVRACMKAIEQAPEHSAHGPLLRLGWQLLEALGATIAKEHLDEDLRAALRTGEVNSGTPTRAAVLRFLQETTEQVLGRAYVLFDLNG